MVIISLKPVSEIRFNLNFLCYNNKHIKPNYTVISVNVFSHSLTGFPEIQFEHVFRECKSIPHPLALIIWIYMKADGV